MATSGSFCLLRGNGVGGLPAVTRASDCAAASGNANDAIPIANTATMTPLRFIYSLFTRTAGVLTSAGEASRAVVRTCADDHFSVMWIEVHQPDVAPEIAEHEDDLSGRGDWRSARKIRGHQHFG